MFRNTLKVAIAATITTAVMAVPSVSARANAFWGNQAVVAPVVITPSNCLWGNRTVVAPVVVSQEDDLVGMYENYLLDDLDSSDASDSQGSISLNNCLWGN